jgi:hypothetical protein
MFSYRRANPLVGIALTAIVAAVAWFTVGQGVLDKINDSNERSGGGGPFDERTVSEKQFGPLVQRLHGEIGSEASISLVTMRPDSVEFEVVQNRRASGYRWRRGSDRFERYEVGGTGQAGQASNDPFPQSQLDTKATERMSKAISEAEQGDFHLSIGDLQRADTGKLFWTLRGTIGERGVAYYAPPHGTPIKAYNPGSSELSKGAALGECIRKAGADVAKVQRCVARYAK